MTAVRVGTVVPVETGEGGGGALAGHSCGDPSVCGLAGVMLTIAQPFRSYRLELLSVPGDNTRMATDFPDAGGWGRVLGEKWQRGVRM